MHWFDQLLYANRVVRAHIIASSYSSVVCNVFSKCQRPINLIGNQETDINKVMCVVACSK